VGTATITATAGSKTANCAVTVTIPISLPPFDMVAVTGGTFLMGAQNSASDADNYDIESQSNEAPVHSVTLSGFSIGKHEVTQELWWAVMGSWSGMTPSSAYGKGDDYPLYAVSWNAIVGTGGSVGYTEKGIDYYTDGFCYKLSVLANGGTLGATHYRLPTEAEWEYAARGGSGGAGFKYSGSNTIGDVAWYSGNASNRTHSVGTKAANELGIFDMSGNVWEWCGDWYDAYSSIVAPNPTGAVSGTYRVNRSGCWGNDAEDSRVSARRSNADGFFNNNVGFRLAL
jgi:formylglycine-generating enzyme required for sulfatase activity